MSKSQRQRRLARARWERQQQRRADQQRSRRRRTRRILTVTLALVVVAGVVAAVVWLTRGDDDLTALAESDASPTAVTCTYLDAGESPRDVGRPPAVPLDPPGTSATITLDGADVEVVLEPQAAPCTVSSWQFLAAADFFDDTPCHRLTTEATLKVLQCGSPDGSPNGGPGYRFAEENLAGATYPAGTVAMARTAEPGTTGSQFFLVYGDSQLPPDYTVVGRVVSGLEVVEAIAERGLADDGVAPAEPVTLDDLVVATG